MPPRVVLLSTHTMAEFRIWLELPTEPLLTKNRVSNSDVISLCVSGNTNINPQAETKGSAKGAWSPYLWDYFEVTESPHFNGQNGKNFFSAFKILKM